MALVGVFLVLIVLQHVYDQRPWMPHGDRAKQLLFAFAAFGWSGLHLYSVRQSRRLLKTYRDTPYLGSLQRHITPLWVSMSMVAIGCVVGVYFLALFLLNSHVDMTRTSDLFQLFLGIVLALSGVFMLRPLTLGKRDLALTSTDTIFVVFLPALLIAAGIGRCVVVLWRMIR